MILSAGKINQLMEFFGVRSVKQLEQTLGLSNGYIGNLEKRETENPGRLLVALNKCGISADWVFSAHNEMTLKELTSQLFDGKKFSPKSSQVGLTEEQSGGDNTVECESSEKKEDIMKEATEHTRQPVSKDELPLNQLVHKRIPVIVEGENETGFLIPMLDQKLSAGFGIDYEEGEVIKYIKAPAWLARMDEHLAALPVIGDSMNPTVNDSDIVVCRKNGFCGDGVYVIQDEDEGMMFCKRVVWDPEGWDIMSDNPIYSTKRLKKHNIKVVGQVVATLKKMR
jgi:phage repressor protein C with HTH and peptisase S24 domain